jgi:hypothetical protein
MVSILQIYKVSPRMFLPTEVNVIPEGEGQHQRPFFCFGAQGTWTTALRQSNALDDDGLHLNNIKDLG